MLKRLFDVTASSAALVLAAPLMLLAAAAVRLASPGPVLYRAVRSGRGGRPFEMLKFRTMHHARVTTGPVITGAADARVFPVGAFLRRTKIDELPQLLNVLRGEMSVVGPRPEAPEIVAAHYGADGWRTLQTRPGLTSPGALFYYLYSDEALAAEDPEEAYVRRLLPEKLALEVEYLSRRSLGRDVGVILSTVVIILMLGLGRRDLLVRWFGGLRGRRQGRQGTAGLGGVSQPHHRTEWGALAGKLSALSGLMTPRPLITVIIPVFQEAAYLDRCLGSLTAGSWPPDRLEILVADGGSTDGARERVGEWERRCSSVRLLDNPDRYVPQAINRGIRAGSGEVVVFMGAHAEAPPNWLECVWEDLQEHPEVAGVGGAWDVVGDSPAGKSIALAQSTRIGVGGNSYRNGTRAGYADTIIYGAYRRDVFVRHGMLDEEMVRDQDDELNIRLLAAGERLWFDPRIRIRYYGRGSYRHLWRQYYQYGFWKVRLWQKVGRLGSWRQLAPMAFVAAGVAATLALPLGGPARLLGAAFWALYVAVVGLGALLAARRDPSRWLGVATAIVILHAAYGLGFWEGLFRFGLLRSRARPRHAVQSR